MISYIEINSVKYYPEDGVALNDKATEELDTITFRINNVSELSLEPFMSVKVVLSNYRELFFIVNTWVDEVATYNGLRNYIITCISETKKLERVQLPNMTITQPLNQTKRTYSRYIGKGMRYVNKMYPEIVVASELYAKIGKEIAVEEQFNTPNAKEYFNSILEKQNAIVKIENNKIWYFDLAKEGNEIDTSKVLFSNNSQTIEDYYSEIVTDVQGVQSEDSTVITELVGVRAPESAVVTYDNAVIQLSHNINFLKEVKMWAKVKVNGNEKIQGYMLYGQVPNTDKFNTYVKEKSEYDLLRISNEVTDYSNDIKRTHLFYTRGGNTIEGLSYNEKTWIPGFTSVLNTIENLIAKINSENSYEAFFDGDIRDLKFEVTYSAIDDVSTKFEKDTITKSVVRDNQTDSYVDLDKFAKAEQEKINRLGNPTMEINARYYNLNDVPNLMDKIGDYILAEREIVYHNNYIDFKGVLYKDYVKKNLFYGVNAKKRSTQLIMGNEAVTRKEVIKEKYEFSYNDDSTDKTTQRYFLGNICSNNLDPRLSNAILQGRWIFNDVITSGGSIDFGDEETSVTKTIFGDFKSINSVDNLFSFNRIDIEYYSSTSKYVLKYNQEEVFDGENWVEDNFKTLEVIDYSHVNTLGVEKFHSFLKENATKSLSSEVQIAVDTFDYKPIQIVTCESKLSDGKSLFYKLEPDVRKANTNITVNFKWYDNINVGMQFDGIKTQNLFEGIQGKGGYGQQYVTYTDNNGELDKIVLKMYDGYNYDISKDNFEYIDTYPKYNVGYIDIYKNFYSKEIVVDKDNREILNYTVQFEFSAEDGIYITDRFVDLIPIFKKEKKKLYVWTSSSRYNKYNYKKVLDDSTKHTDDLEIDYTDFADFVENYNAFNCIKLYNKGVSLTSINSYAIADDEGNVYIAVNTKFKLVGHNRVKQTTIYLNKKGE